jgi:hypothetical protein
VIGLHTTKLKIKSSQSQNGKRFKQAKQKQAKQKQAKATKSPKLKPDYRIF